MKNVLAEWFCPDWFRGEIKRVALLCFILDYKRCNASTSLRDHNRILNLIKIILYIYYLENFESKRS